jgi:hypothetical protein
VSKLARKTTKTIENDEKVASSGDDCEE